MDRLFAGEELTGEVAGLVFADSGSGFGVVELRGDSGETARCAGPLADLVEGQTVRLVGSWRTHPTYGETFRTTYYEQLAPTTVAGLRAFLGSSRFEDVPPRAVERVLVTFGSAAGGVIERDPQRLVDEALVDPGDAALLHERWQAGRALAELVRLCEPAQVPDAVVRAIHAHYGSEAPETVRADPYAILAVERCRFAHADALARRLGVDPLDPRRLSAGAVAALAAAQRREGHQYLTRIQCTQAAARLLKVDGAAAGDGVRAAAAAGRLVIDGGEGTHPAVYTPAGLEAERDLACDLARILHAARSRVRGAAGSAEPSAELTAGQAEAVRLALQTPVAVLTGGPGTGKTRTVQEVVAAAEQAGLNLALCAPTGRAAKRLEELVGRPAGTIHRLLEARPRPDGTFLFGYGNADPLPHDVVVCDEVSMCDTWLAGRLAAAVDDGAHLLLVGDPDQLPPVGPGDVLRDVLASGAVPSVRLTEIHRQAARSRIVALANEINAGAVGPLSPADGDVFLAEEVRPRIVRRVVQAVARRVPAHLGIDPADVQVVAPVYRGAAGVDALNRALKAELNPPAGRPAVAGFHVGDRVMQTRNDTDLDVSNGDIGTVVDADLRRRALRVAFPRGEVTYEGDRARNLVVAWAVTVHKSQGGEWPVVVFVCDRTHAGMLTRNLAYTAVTRAQRALIVVGQQAALRAAAAHDVPRNRQTGLARRLRERAASAAVR